MLVTETDHLVDLINVFPDIPLNRIGCSFISQHSSKMCLSRNTADHTKKQLETSLELAGARLSELQTTQESSSILGASQVLQSAMSRYGKRGRRGPAGVTGHAMEKGHETKVQEGSVQRGESPRSHRITD